jgi:hypothetical protein
MNIKAGYVFQIHTNSYAGNFEREIAAHCTGQVGECGVGEEYIPKDRKLRFSDIIQHCPDDNGCERPVEILGKDAKTVGILFYEKPSDDHLEYMMSQAKTFAETRRNSGHEWDKNFELEIEGFSGTEVRPSLSTEKL